MVQKIIAYQILTLLVNECAHPSKLSGNGPRLMTVTFTVRWGEGRANVSSRGHAHKF